ncbi:uncharacterized protein LOC116296361 [Actinia tenebrosa]|uniref:Uncharacterized protein LOC116296361 n=1 Tax=Actinia tenebrosa TaxID=6105 RepID=A0A6P8I686_ACTTE|nr:uncharacterized protein LOC116296361 [Actinia tenebrosa]
MVMEITQCQPGHTPFCKKTCSVKHCELIVCLVTCPDNKRMIKGLASLKQSLFQALQEGWNPHANVVDPLIEFQTPLIHWATVLGKDFALEWLIKMNFRTNAVCDRTGESAVHRMLKCLYSIKQLDGMSAREIFTLFSHLLSLLMGSCPDLLTIQDNEGNTPFHTCAKLIISQEGTTSELEYFENCMVTMLRSLTGDKSSAKSSDTSSVLNYKNNNSETILHILARRNASFNIMRYVIRRFNHVLDKNCLNKEGKSAFDIAINSQTYSVAKELGSTDDQGADHSATSFSVDLHIGEWDPSFGRPTKIQTSRPRQRSKKPHTRSESKSTQSRNERIVCEETNEVETLEVDSSASSTSSTTACMASGVGDGNKQTSSSPELIFHQDSDSPSSRHSPSGTDQKMDVNIAGMISVNLTNVVAIDTEDLSVNRVNQDVIGSPGGGDGSEQLEFDQHSLAYISHQVRQRSETRRKSTGSKERSERIGVTTASLRSSAETRKASDPQFQSVSPSCQHGGNNACYCRTCSPLMKLIKEEDDVVTLLEARLKDKRQKLETYLLDYTKQMREVEKKGSRCCLLLSEYKDERDAIIEEDQLKERERRKLLQRLEELEKSRIEPNKRLKFLDAKILELESLSEQSLKTIEIRNEHCSEVKRKLTEYDSALSEIACQNESVASTKRIKVEPLDE